MRQILKITLIIASLFSIMVVIAGFHIVCGFSQTFELGQGVYTGITEIDLQVGDRVEGSFSINNLGPYERLFGNGTSYEVVDLWCKDPSSQTILNFSATPNENSFNFSFTAQEQGLYSIWTFSGAMDYLRDAKDPVLSLNFDIVEGTTPSPKPTSPYNEPVGQEVILGLAVTVAVLAVGLGLLVYLIKRK